MTKRTRSDTGTEGTAEHARTDGDGSDVERLRKVNRALVEALERVATTASESIPLGGDPEDNIERYDQKLWRCADIAREALALARGGRG